MMKNLKHIFSLVMLLLLIYSCSNEDYLGSEDFETTETNIARKATVLKRAEHPIYRQLGSGYNVTEDYANNNSIYNQIIDINKFSKDHPSRVSIENISSQEYVEQYGENARAYSKKVSGKLDLGIKVPVFKKVLSTSFKGSLTSNSKFDGKYIYASYDLTIRQKRYRFNATSNLLKNYLSDAFKEDLKILSPEQIVRFYGTHLLVDIYTGAKLSLKYQSETSNIDRSYAARIGLKAGVKKIFNLDVSNDINTSSSSKNFNRKLSYVTRGGDASKELTGVLNLDQSTPKINISSWQNSSTPENSVLIDFSPNSVVLIYELVSDPAKRASLKSYIDQYLIDNQVNLEYIEKSIYRYYNPSSGDHFYTKKAGSIKGYNYEGVEFKAYTYKAPNTVPIYRYWNGKDHLYTQSPGAPIGYISEGIEFYAYKNKVSGSTPIHRYYNPSTGDHFYTRTYYSNLFRYRYEGISFYAY